MRIRNKLCSLALAFTMFGLPTDAQIELIPQGADWRYLDTGVAPPANWNSPFLFDHSSWKEGPAQFGYGEMDEATEISFGLDPENKFITTWFRHEFPVADPSLFQNVRLRVLRDDGILVYLNGVEIVRSNMPDGGGTASTLAFSPVGNDEEDHFFSFDIDPALFFPGDNLLAVELHQFKIDSSDTSFDADLFANVAPSVIRGPYLQVTKPDGITVCWRTDVATDGRVWFGATPGNLVQFATDTQLTQNHSIELSGLAAETEFAYAVGTTAGILAGDDTNHVFKTAPPIGAARPTRVWALGDSGTGNIVAAAVRDAYLGVTGSTQTDVVLLLGDNAYTHGTDGEYEFSLFKIYSDEMRRSTFWSTRGNHEQSGSTYFSIFEMPTLGEAGGLASGTEKYYSFDHGNVHFICLDSHASNRDVGAAMWTWAQADLMSNDKDWTVAFWHHPAYTKGSHDSDNELQLIEMRENFLPLLEAHGVDIVLSGHSHSYERTFLINGHYSHSLTWDPARMLMDGGDGKLTGDGAYIKPIGPNQGATYITAGSSGKVSSDKPLDHPAMYYSVESLGSTVLNFDNNQLDVQFVNVFGAIEDEFTLRKEVPLVADINSLSIAAGGTQSMTVEAGSGRAGHSYWMFGSATGTSPGIDFSATINLPLNFDCYFSLTLFKPGSAIFENYVGLLDAEGGASVKFHLPAGSDPGFAGITLSHAYLTSEIFGDADYASNAISVELTL